jgi:prophage tail gpP-like protein
MSEQAHNVAIRIGSTVVEKWSNYEIENDMLHPADSFQLELGGCPPDAWRLCKEDSPIQVQIDDTVVLSGIIDDRTRTVGKNGSFLHISGRDRSGRVVDESMPLQSLEGLTTLDLVLRAISPWYSDVIVTNEANRAAVRGKGAPLARAAGEPPLSDKLRTKHSIRGKAKRLKVSPGESRWTTLQRFLEDDGLLAWSTADGKSIVIGQPNYNQEPQYAFFLPKPGSARIREGNLLEYSLHESVAERYSQVTAVALGVDDSYHYSATVKNGPGPGGEGLDFIQPKRLMIADSRIVSTEDAKIRAQLEMDERDGQGSKLSLRVRGHNQVRIPGKPAALYAFDCMARVEDEELEMSGLWLITRVTFSHSKDSGETTHLDLVRKGTVLKA